jgi:hypothetical protein
MKNRLGTAEVVRRFELRGGAGLVELRRLGQLPTPHLHTVFLPVPTPDGEVIP